MDPPESAWKPDPKPHTKVDCLLMEDDAANGYPLRDHVFNDQHSPTSINARSW
jgi:hypothetical protein